MFSPFHRRWAWCISALRASPVFRFRTQALQPTAPTGVRQCATRSSSRTCGFQKLEPSSFSFDTSSFRPVQTLWTRSSVRFGIGQARRGQNKWWRHRNQPDRTRSARQSGSEGARSSFSGGMTPTTNKSHQRLNRAGAAARGSAGLHGRSPKGSNWAYPGVTGRRWSHGWWVVSLRPLRSARVHGAGQAFSSWQAVMK